VINVVSVRTLVTAALIVLGVIALVVFLASIVSIVLVVLVAIVFAEGIRPLVDELHRRKVPRAVGILAVYVGVLAFIAIMVLLLPTMILIELKFPQFRKVLEFVCLIPITIPTVVLVVGFIPAYQTVAQIFGSTPYTLAFAIGIICLPYAFRPIATMPTSRNIRSATSASGSTGNSSRRRGWPRAGCRLPPRAGLAPAASCSSCHRPTTPSARIDRR